MNLGELNLRMWYWLEVKISKQTIQNLIIKCKKNITTNGYLVISNRGKNNNFSYKYGINSNIIKQIICNLKYSDFIEVLRNEHKGYEDECLYLFAPIIKLTNVAGKTNKMQIYLKINYIEKKRVVIVVSIHKASYRLKYYFKEE